MTNESSIDSTRKDHEVSPRRAAREARRRAEALAQGLEAPLPGSDSADSAASASSSLTAASAPSSATPEEAAGEPQASASQLEHLAPDAVQSAASGTAASAPVPTPEELATREKRSRSFAAAQRASSEGALRARREAMEAQRAAAERVRETLRANAVGPRRAARAASSSSALTPASATADSHTAQPTTQVSSIKESVTSPDSATRNVAPTSSAAPFDQNATPEDHFKTSTSTPTTDQLSSDDPVRQQLPTAPPHVVQPVQPIQPPVQQPEKQIHHDALAQAEPRNTAPSAAMRAPDGWDARDHESMSFNDILTHPIGITSRPQVSSAETTASVAPSPNSAPASQPSPEALTQDTREAIPAGGNPQELPEPYPAELDPATEAFETFQGPDALAQEAAQQYATEQTHTDVEAEHEYFEDAYYAHDAADPVDPQARENLFIAGPTPDDAQFASARKTRKRRRNGVMAAVIVGFIAVIVAVVLILQGVLAKLNPADYPSPGGDAVTFEVKSGWGTNQIGKNLVAQDIVASEKLFSEAVQLVETDNREIHPGTYDLRKQMPALDAATILIGDGAPKVGYVAIKQNVRMPAVLEEIAKSSGLPLKDLQKLANEPKTFGIKSEAKNLEGYLHPGEYRFPIDADAKTVLQMMVDATQKSLKDQGITDPTEGYRALKIASILQAEARPNDYAVVAGALENRLHPNNTETNGLLQVDSTVIYGLNRYTLQISKAEKVDAGNPYNSYVHKGLPPTPIGSPGDSALKAAANPTANDYYYWVTVNTNTGETKFAKTYREHLVNQNEFRAWCAANTDVCK
ncbi:hypothetical protein CQ018_09150 [Arthrobacter sp. MYb227]|uniref:endolytic transglycosylase MltG n=1 Tax=Arthrobacter sp. MYb227 TaxID=1848601 RepID=UPI000CFD0BB3|nr:endolytic transglycosylase MltG [Arthrobacter sp. MYb227]PQZ93805.1 hypothetical protein CQ018_09150 [Arthrobacter sp. MYb227]